MNSSFQSKVAFITGGANGIGRATALAFAREGASVVVADVSEAGNQETARMIEALGRRALAVRCDVSRAEDVKAALAKTVEVFGRLDFAFCEKGLVRRDGCSCVGVVAIGGTACCRCDSDPASGAREATPGVGG